MKRRSENVEAVVAASPIIAVTVAFGLLAEYAPSLFLWVLFMAARLAIVGIFGYAIFKIGMSTFKVGTSTFKVGKSMYDKRENRQ